MTDVDHIFQAIRRLPVREQLRLVERVAHDLADTFELVAVGGGDDLDDEAYAQIHAVIDAGVAASDDEGIDAADLIAETRSRG